MISKSISLRSAQKLPEYLFYRVQNKNNAAYKMIQTKAHSLAPVYEINVKKSNLINAVKLKFDRDYKGGFRNQKDADAAAQFITAIGNKSSKPIIINDFDYDPYFVPSVIKAGVMDIRTSPAKRKAEILAAKNEVLKAFDNLFDRNTNLCDSISDIVDSSIYFGLTLVRKEPKTRITSNQTLRNKLEKIQNNDYKLRMLHNDLSNLVYNPANK